MELLRWQPELSTSQPWRIYTAHWLHVNVSHLAINLASLLAAFSLFPELIKLRYLLVCLLLPPLGVGLGLSLLDSDITWYVGYSGALYGLLTSGAIVLYKRNPFVLWVAGFVIIKIAWEQFLGPIESDVSLPVNQIATQSHLYGAISGVLLGTLLRLYEACESAKQLTN
ncbi:rhombosortase [Agarivorans sp. Alg241-V36]|uniref:rhombosortase n=1 Tax=Agarivorans sp. Alg241-V36 TaxID=2305992 RepID=UPI0013D196DA|nr:rhombosortase [Agarivorans sp. Alg241-V36]